MTTKNRINLFILVFGLLFANCKNETKIGYLASYAHGLSGAVALAVDQINESQNESRNESRNKYVGFVNGNRPILTICPLLSHG